MARFQTSKAESKAVKEWLAKGNKITKCPPGAKTEEEDIILKWQRGRPKVEVQKRIEENNAKKLKD
jgi:Na+-translocating ferredoxin:NAD+ oxidoreductase RNF subunit RnfB